MNSVTVSEARNHFDRLLERVIKGEEIVITRLEKPMARLVPESRRSLKAVKAAVAALHELRGRIAIYNKGRAKLKTVKVKSWIEEGRR